MLRLTFLALLVTASVVTACTAAAPAATTKLPTPTAAATPTVAVATRSAVAVVTPSPTSAAPTVAPKTTDPYANPDDKYTPRPSPASTPDATPDPVEEQVVVSVSPDGNYLVGPEGMTLYTFDNDDENESNCDGGCLAAWPPLAVDHDRVLVGDDGVDGELAAFHRADDSHQASYNGQPLYYYAADQEPGDTLGDGVNGTWHLATP